MKCILIFVVFTLILSPLAMSEDQTNPKFTEVPIDGSDFKLVVRMALVPAPPTPPEHLAKGSRYIDMKRYIFSVQRGDGKAEVPIWETRVAIGGLAGIDYFSTVAAKLVDESQLVLVYIAGYQVETQIIDINNPKAAIRPAVLYEFENTDHPMRADITGSFKDNSLTVALFGKENLLGRYYFKQKWEALKVPEATTPSPTKASTQPVE
jgi:hypothetical protein